MEKTYLASTQKLFAYYKKLGDDAMEQVADEKLFFQPNEDSNSIAIIVQHIAGNMLSRWTDFLTTDGEKDWRNRDAEFEANITNRQDLLVFWNKGWNCLFGAMNSLTETDLEKTIYIRNEGHTVVEAINRQLAHYPYHVGQLIFLAKMLNTMEWESLSIPKNKSQDYNQDKFSKEKGDAFFTDKV
ncbi:MAG TPA: DUF1572 domain-containing protein [Chitinophagales bacterium]|nr:DUF1572 domain-containing protein [Chitinophagales bacterium]